MRRGEAALDRHDDAEAKRHFQDAQKYDPNDDVAAKYVDMLGKEDAEKRDARERREHRDDEARRREDEIREQELSSRRRHEVKATPVPEERQSKPQPTKHLEGLPGPSSVTASEGTREGDSKETASAELEPPAQHEERPSSEHSALRVKKSIKEASLLKAPSPFAAEIARLSPGTSLSLVSEKGTWYEVRLTDGRTGFVSVDEVERVQ